MKDSWSFAVFDPLREVAEVCGVCLSSAPIFRYESHGNTPEGEPREAWGFCCASCAAQLLKKLESAETREWKQERVALEAEGITVPE